ncbi:hypothetical protein KAI58_04000 [Candidatus Gracilibacteria bacterium]|nr:hypothetical protein [Candidatus Gracilibacteria bacterium]
MKKNVIVFICTFGIICSFLSNKFYANKNIAQANHDYICTIGNWGDWSTTCSDGSWSKWNPHTHKRIYTGVNISTRSITYGNTRQNCSGSFMFGGKETKTAVTIGNAYYAKVQQRACSYSQSDIINPYGGSEFENTGFEQDIITEKEIKMFKLFKVEASNINAVEKIEQEQHRESERDERNDRDENNNERNENSNDRSRK